jgi:MoaA/NifB/PqqE/SkfB family radical SAM enzyme/membrane protein YqaA with SNARE-associated domain
MDSSETSQFDRMTPRTWALVAITCVLSAIGIGLIVVKPNEYQYLTIFLYSIPSNIGISLFPHEPVLVWYGKTINLWGLSAFATGGTLAAAYLDYRIFASVLNLPYSASYKSTFMFQKAHRWFYKVPFLSLVVAGFSPVPFYPFKFMVYSTKYPLRRYLLAIIVGRFPRYFILGAVGYSFQVPTWIIITSAVGMPVLVYYRKIFTWIAKPFIIVHRLIKRDSGVKRAGKSQTISKRVVFGVALQTIKNMILNKPICVALEVTHNCNANCYHCDKGAKVEDNMVGPADFKRILDEIGSPFIQIAGGEPMLRKDLPDIVRSLHSPQNWPLLVLITNASLLTVDKYHELREAGISQFSISLDFPDHRHDRNRMIPGLFAHLDDLIPQLVSFKNSDVAVNCCITRKNYPYIKNMVAICRRWKVKMNFSVYTELRTLNQDLNLAHPGDTNKLDRLIDELYADPDLAAWTMTSEKVIRSFNNFFVNGMCQPNCQAGYRFVVVNPDGQLTPCAMHIETRYPTLKGLVQNFSRPNTCSGCYISTRGNTEKSFFQLAADNLAALRISRRAVGD